MKSWKTTLCGILGALCAGAAQTPGIKPEWQHLLNLGSQTALALGLLFARDFNKSSEQHGLAPEPPKT